MRTTILAGAAIVALVFADAGSASAQDAGMADLDDFGLKTGQDLVDLCAADEGDSMYVDARLFCLGVIEGMIQYHDAVGHGPDGDLVVCPEGGAEVTRSGMVDIVVNWAKANPDQASTVWPAEAVVLAALDAWGPCER